MLIFLGAMVGLSLLNKVFFRGDSWSRSFFLGFLCAVLLTTIFLVVFGRPPENIEAALALLPGSFTLILLGIVSFISAATTKFNVLKDTEEAAEEKESGTWVDIFQMFVRRLVVWTCIFIIVKAILGGGT